ncbi:ATP-grasp domain-containing protein [Falsiroseomonas oryziterrae]|uniref:ATP-grasp domain-containing protein n=1 Tax=Falsiroseomonas oryziterrae TaxID=2911368 RepID=UPI001F17EC4F|nr:ATP-grasp domain-containing protein [Roseomonas sp. NPKOSM-4]
MSTVLVTLGRLPKALDLCRSFALAGWRVVVAEPHARHLCGASNSVTRSLRVPAPAEGKGAYLRALAEVARFHGAQLVVPVSEEALHVAFLPKLLPGLPVFAMPPAAMLALHHKGGFVEAARVADVAVPETHALGSDAAAAMARAARVVVKPAHSAAGRGVRVLAPGEALPHADPGQPAVVQRFLPGPEYSSCSLARGGRVLGTAIYRGVQFAGSVAVAFERVEHAEAEAWIARIVAALGWTGFISFDMREDEAGRIHGIECNPRTTSGLHFFETADIAPAILGVRDALRLRDQTRLQQFWSCLTETQLAAFRREKAALGHLRNLVSTRDVTWAARDPMPLLSMPWTAWPILREAARKRVPFGEVATLDVGWFEGERRPAEVSAAAAAPATAASRTSAAT